MTRIPFIGWASLFVAMCATASFAGNANEVVVHLDDFETPGDVGAWEFNSGTPSLCREGVAHGSNAVDIAFDPKGPYHPAYLTWRKVRRDWSGFDALMLDVLNPNAEAIPGTVLIADKAWADGGRSYWNRHNGSTTFAPGRTRWVISVGGLYRGEAGSRNNDIKRNIDANSIVRLDFGFGSKGSAGRVILDDIRLVKVRCPAGIRAFDLGPVSQSVMPGWTAISHASVYSRQQGYGWGPAGGAPWDGADRDTAFGPALLRDFCEAGGYRFRVNVPAGTYRATILYENSGYWGGEQAMHTTRRILANDREVWSETRADGSAHALHRFEDVEPVGVDIWDTYMKGELARPVVFNAEASHDGMTLRFEADRVWGSKICALALHRADDTNAAAWLAGELDEVASEFRRMAVCLDQPAGAFDPPAAWQSSGLVAWPVTVEDDVTPATLPPADAKGPEALTLSRLAVRNATTALGLAIRPTAATGRRQVRFEWLSAPSPLSTDVSLVWYNTSRDFNSIAYHIKSHTLRPCGDLALARGVTRELILRIPVPARAVAGDYRGQLTVQGPPGDKPLRVPVHLSVSPVVLDRSTDFRMGFFGVMPPSLVPQQHQEETLDQTLGLLREYGMNLVCGGPDWTLKGWQGGAPVIDFEEMDRFVSTLRKHGFDGPLNGYGGARFAGLHNGYEKGRTGAQVERDSGLAYTDALMRAWSAVDVHARASGWPTIWYAMCDETRVRSDAERELEFMKMMGRVSAAFPRTVRTSGSYSVGFNKRPGDPDDLLYWHQRFFEALDISDLNGHDPTVLDEARRLKKEVHIYNQGVSRYAFGLYAWSEYQRGVRARTEWHLNILHGYQFFDLDGREPDTAMICYGRKGIYPTIHLERCRQGAEDFHLLQTLSNAVERCRREQRPDRAIEAGDVVLKKNVPAIGLNQRTMPEAFDPERMRAGVIAAIEALDGGNPAR